ncbi:hypothetical protein E1956_36645 [Paraburkholderia pallida]|uniref:Uncharacterized protein n=1 Tax=Paraburkholderia pallida TaxID=2547399 RepID=A0A4P7D7M4_9BURK|nr:hypothetical protein E1956_36645 [Paraburkholderia pallida]
MPDARCPMPDESSSVATGLIGRKPRSRCAAPPLGFFPIRRRISALYTPKPLALAFLQCRICVCFAE